MLITEACWVLKLRGFAYECYSWLTLCEFHWKRFLFRILMKFGNEIALGMNWIALGIERKYQGNIYVQDPSWMHLRFSITSQSPSLHIAERIQRSYFVKKKSFSASCQCFTIGVITCQDPSLRPESNTT